MSLPANLLKFEKATDFTGFKVEFPIYKYQYTQDIAKNFRENMVRVITLGTAPLMIAGISSISSFYQAVAINNLGFPFDSAIFNAGHPDFSLELTMKKQIEHAKMIQDWQKSQQNMYASLRAIGIANLPQIEMPGDGPNDGLIAILEAMVQGAWTAFEILATDLWVKSLNRGPSKWINKVLDGLKKRGLKGDRVESKEQEKSITLSKLTEYGYDLKYKMGTLLKSEGKVDFQSLENIRAAYVALFGEKATALFATQEGEAVEALEQFRNLLAHRAGEMDEKFKRKTAKYVNLEEGKWKGTRIIITGEIAQLMVVTAVLCGNALISMADEAFQEAYWCPEI